MRKLAIKTKIASCFRLQAFLVYTLNLCVLTWWSMEDDSFLEPATSGRLRNCSFWHVRKNESHRRTEIIPVKTVIFTGNTIREHRLPTCLLRPEWCLNVKSFAFDSSTVWRPCYLNHSKGPQMGSDGVWNASLENNKWNPATFFKA